MAKAEYDTIAGSSSEAVKKATGQDWAGWVKTLDKENAQKLPHKEIAAMLHEKFDVSEWWAQMVTVGYERIKGLRVKNQKADGFEVSASKTVAVDAVVALEAFTDAKRLKTWFGKTMKLRTSNAGKSARFDAPEETGCGGVVSLWLTAKAADKTSVALQHSQLADEASVETMRAYWKAALDRYKSYLES
jgi:uncharacterized protein YndB with AHSA1/START domain